MVKKWYRDDPHSMRRFDYDLGPASLVLDLGGYRGQWSSDMFSMYGCRIIVFEPVFEFATFIETRFKHNAKIDVHPFGLGGRSRAESMGVCGTSSSLFAKSSHSERVRIVDIAEFMRDEGIDRIDLMKVNIEGGEYELLDRLIETGQIGIVRDLQIQFHRIAKDSARRMQEIQDRLRVTHLPTYQYRFVWENWTRNDGALGPTGSSARG